MGIFSNSANTTPIINVSMAEGYDDDQYSAQVAMIESYQNSFAIFDGVIRSDIQEAAMKHQGVNDYEIMSFSEGVIGDLFNKIKEFFKKLWAKIKSIFHNFMARFDAKFGKNNKEFIKKYRKDIYGKDLSDFEVEYRKKNNVSFGDIQNFPDIDEQMSPTHITSTNQDDPEKVDKWIQKQQDDNDFTCKLLEITCNNKISLSSPSEYDKEVTDYLFDESSKDSINLNEIIDEMMTFKEKNKELKRANDNLNKIMDKLIKLIDKDQAAALRHQPLTDNNTAEVEKRHAYELKTNADNRLEIDDSKVSKVTMDKKHLAAYQKALGFVSRRAHCIQTAVSKFTSIIMKLAKFENAQNRRIIAKVIAYKRKEEAFSEEFADLIEWEADCMGVY